MNTVRKTRAITRSPMKRRQSWIWEDRLLGKPTMVCNDCGHPWQQNPLPDQVRHKDALVEPPPGLQGGQKPKKMKKIKDTNLPKAIKEHWESALKVQCTALGLQAAEPPQPAQEEPAAKRRCQEGTLFDFANVATLGKQYTTMACWKTPNTHISG